jgi:hypothetical protein
LQGDRVDACTLEGFPGGLEEESLLGIDGERFARANAKEGGLEVLGVVEKASFARVALALSVGVGIERVSRFHPRFSGKPEMASFSSSRSFQRSSGVCTPPGKRQLIATMAMGLSASRLFLLAKPFDIQE